MMTRRAVLASFGAPALRAEERSWVLWSPRPEIAPKEGGAAPGRLVLEARGEPAVFGGYEAVFQGVEPGRWFRLTVRYRSNGLAQPARQAVARIDWMNSKQRRAGQPDYAWRARTVDGWTELSLEAPAPQEAAAAKVQLLLVDAVAGRVEWSGARFEPMEAPAARPVRVAAVRYRPPGRVAPGEGVAQFISLVDRSVQDADLIVLPEGITVVSTGKGYTEVAEALPGPTTEALAALARRKRAWIVAGLYEKEGTAVYNTAVLISREGRLAGKYRKVYLPREEYEGGINAGREFPVFDTDFGKLGMMICWDVHFADPARALALRGADVIAMPIWGGNEALAKARAIENQVFLATSGYDFPSLILARDGETLTRSEENGTIAAATIDLNRRYMDRWLGEMRARFQKEVRADVTVDPPGRR